MSATFNRSAILRRAWRRYRALAEAHRLAAFDRRLFAACLKRAWAESSPERREAARALEAKPKRRPASLKSALARLASLTVETFAKATREAATRRRKRRAGLQWGEPAHEFEMVRRADGAFELRP